MGTKVGTWWWWDSSNSSLQRRLFIVVTHELSLTRLEASQVKRVGKAIRQSCKGREGRNVQMYIKNDNRFIVTEGRK